MYDLILADCPWRYSFSRSKSREIGRHYPTMALHEIAYLPVERIAAPDSVLYLWATAPKLPEALQVIKAWGFCYKTHMIWDKMKIGMGYWCRGRHELLLIGTRGTPKIPEPGVRIPSVQRETRDRHSAKPDWAYTMIEVQHPHARKIELFARARRSGWSSWGDEIPDSDVDLTPNNGGDDERLHTVERPSQISRLDRATGRLRDLDRRP